jgi:hypothetical protein
MLGLAARFHLAGVTLNEHLAWVSSTPSLIALGFATITELAADKIPIVDHALGMVGTVTKPLAATLAVAATFHHMSPGTAALAGLVLGVPTALAVHTAQAGTRVTSTATTAGLANPLISTLEDIIAFGTAGAALLAPLIVPLLLILFGASVWAIMRRIRRPRTGHS